MRPAAILLLVLLWAGGLCANFVHLYAADLGAVAPTGLTEAQFAAAFALGYLGLALAHELGHVATYRMLGMAWDRISIGAGLGVRSPTPRTFRAQLLISAGGPLLHVLAGALALAAASSPWTLIGLIGLVGIAEGALNLALPMGRNSDASKVYRCAWAILRGRGRQLV